MATERKKRTALLAILLALLAAGTLCVWGAAAAGFSFSSPALEAAIQAFNNTRAGDGGASTNGGGDVNISVPGNGNGDGTGNGDGGDGDGDGDTGGDGGSDAGGNGCFLGILCLNVDGDGVDADVDGVDIDDVDGVNGLNVDINGSSDNGNLLDVDVNGEGDEAGGLNIGGLHINATGDADDSEAVLAAAATASGNEEGSCFLNLICLTANADASTNDVTDAVVDVNVHDEDEDVNVDVDADGVINTDAGNDSFLDSILNLFVNADAN
jgi:hypothetical protein